MIICKPRTFKSDLVAYDTFYKHTSFSMIIRASIFYSVQILMKISSVSWVDDKTYIYVTDGHMITHYMTIEAYTRT